MRLYEFLNSVVNANNYCNCPTGRGLDTLISSLDSFQERRKERLDSMERDREERRVVREQQQEMQQQQLQVQQQQNAIMMAVLKEVANKRSDNDD
jgi:hypothetical protein